MDKMEGLRAGVAEMRSVAQRLNQWADDLEASFCDQKAATTEVQAAKTGEDSTTASGGNFVGSEVTRNERAVRGTVATIEGAERASGRKKAPAGKTPVPEAAPELATAEKKKAALSLPEVRAILAEKCAAGFSTQVKALIESYGVSSLKDVPSEKYEELLEAVRGLGDADAG